MALLKCPDCGKDVSDKAAACPSCGCPVKRHISSERRNESVSKNEKVLNSNKRPILIAFFVLAAIIVTFSIASGIIEKNKQATQTYKKSALSLLEDMQRDVTDVKNKTFYMTIGVESYLKYQDAEHQSIVALWGKKEKFKDANLLITECYNIYEKVLYLSEPNNTLSDKDIEELALTFSTKKQKAEQLVKQIK